MFKNILVKAFHVHVKQGLYKLNVKTKNLPEISLFWGHCDMILTNILGMKIHRDIIMIVKNLHIYYQKINFFVLITINIFCENITSFDRGRGNLMYVQRHYCSIHWNPIEMFYFRHTFFLWPYMVSFLIYVDNLSIDALSITKVVLFSQSARKNNLDNTHWINSSHVLD